MGFTTITNKKVTAGPLTFEFRFVNSLVTGGTTVFHSTIDNPIAAFGSASAQGTYRNIPPNISDGGTSMGSVIEINPPAGTNNGVVICVIGV